MVVARSARRCWPMAWKSLAPSPRKSCGPATGYQRTLPKPRRATGRVTVVAGVSSELLELEDVDGDGVEAMASQSVVRPWVSEAPRRSRRAALAGRVPE